MTAEFLSRFATRKQYIFLLEAVAQMLALFACASMLSEPYYSFVDNKAAQFALVKGSLQIGQLDVFLGRSIVLSEIKAEMPLQNEIPSHQNVLLEQYQERIKLLPQENKVGEFCVDAGFVHVGEVGQYFMTKDTGDFTKFHTVACREYTLPRDDGSSQPRGWIQGITRVGLVLEVTTSYLFGKHGIEIRIWSLSQDNSHSWVRIFMDQTNLWLIQTTTTQQFLQIYLKNKRHNRV